MRFQALKKYAEEMFSRLFPVDHSPMAQNLDEQNSAIIWETAENELMQAYLNELKQIEMKPKKDLMYFNVNNEFKYYEATMQYHERKNKIDLQSSSYN